MRDFGTTGRFPPPTFRQISSWIGNRRFRPSGGPISLGRREKRDPGTSLAGKGRTRTLSVIAAQGCPCRIDGQHAVVHGPLVAEAASGLPPRPLLVYPMDRSRATPLTAFCPTDVLRNTLGVGPCQYILQTEGLQTDTNPTPDNVMTWIEKQIARKRQKKSADEIRDLVQQMTQHVGHVAERIQRYADLGRDVQKLCTEGEASGSLRTAAATLKPIAEELQRNATATDVTAAPQRVSQLAVQVAALVDQTSPLAECQRLGAELRSARCRPGPRLGQRPDGGPLAQGPSENVSRR